MFQRVLSTLLGPLTQHFMEGNANPLSQRLGVMSLEAARPLLPQLGLHLIFVEVEAKFFVSNILIIAVAADNTDSYSICPRLISTISISIFFHPHCSPLLPSLVHSIVHSISGKIKGSKNVQDGGIAIDRNSDWILVRD